LNRLLDRALAGRLEGEPVDVVDLVVALDGIGVPPVEKLLNTFLRDGDSTKAWQLAWLGARARDATPALRRALSDSRIQVRISAAVALTAIEPSSVDAIPVLIESLDQREDRNLDLTDVPAALARLGPRARAALPRLISLATKTRDDPDVYKALVQIDPEGKECVPALVWALKYEDYEHEYETVDVATNCVGLLGPRARDAIPSLVLALTRDYEGNFVSGYDPQVSAAKALKRIGQPAKAAIPDLTRALRYRHVFKDPIDRSESRDCSGAAASAEVLGSFGPDARSAIPALLEAAQTREKNTAASDLRRAAIRALGEIGQDTETSIPVLRRMLNDSENAVQSLAEIIAALYRLAPDGKSLAEKWVMMPPGRSLTERSPFVASRALVRGVMGQTSLEADYLIRSDLARLCDMFADSYRPNGDPVPMFVGEWFEKLGRFGAGGRLAIPRLREFKKHKNPWVRMWSTEALSHIVLNDN
jgi:HEAT repeat protein